MRSSNRSFVSLLTALSFVVLAMTGVLAFVLPFSIQVIGLHALMGFVFIGLIALHVINNTGHLKRYLRSRTLWTTTGIATGLTVLFLWQPAPIRSVLGLSRNLGPALEHFAVTDQGMTYHYNPSQNYRMTLIVRGGSEFNTNAPPHVAIWLENASFYHIKTLHETGGRAALPYWDFKLRGWEEARREATATGKSQPDPSDLDGVSGATQNSSFDPADYILPADPDDPMPYRLMIEIDQPDDQQPSLVYAVEIDNSDPHAFQLLELMGYPKREEDKGGKEVWSLYYVDERFTTALKLIDSALLTIERRF